MVSADSALYRGKVSKAELEAVIAACSRWPGIGRARGVVEFSDGRSESPFESISRVAFRDGGLPPPELQVWVGGDGGPVGRVDFPPTLTGPAGSYAATPTCARPGSRSCTSAGPS